MSKLITIFLLPLVFLSCTKPGSVAVTKEDEARELAKMRAAIDKVANSVSCTDAADWKFIPIGSKACGGPTGYIAYHKTIDEAAFKKMVDAYTTAQQDFNKKWGVASDCAMVMPPAGVKCEDGKPVFQNGAFL